METLENSSFWAEKLPNAKIPLLSEKEILKLNEKNLKNAENGLNDLQKLNLIKGVVLRRTEVVKAPKDKNISEFDENVESTLFPFEAVMVSEESRDRKYYYVLAVNTCGYVRKSDVAITHDGDLWNLFFNPREFYVVVADKIHAKGFFPQLSMGVKIPIDEYGKAFLPYEEKGALFLRREKVPNFEGLNKGYLEYTYKNILDTAFGCLGSAYGWGGAFGNRDCSSFVCELMKVFGVVVGRNVSNQVESGIRHIHISNMNIEEKKMLICSLPVGTTLSFKGHTAIYIGCDNDKVYIIHAVSQYINNCGEIEKMMKTAVTDVDIRRVSNGLSFMESFSDAVVFSLK